MWKVFVEFDDVDSAKLAKLELDGSNLEDDQNLKISIYSSNLERIMLQENNPAGVGKNIPINLRLYNSSLKFKK
jgi:hypothetical protein